MTPPLLCFLISEARIRNFEAKIRKNEITLADYLGAEILKVSEVIGCNWSAYPNVDVSYRTGDPRLWGITQVKKKGLRDFGAALAPEAAHHIAIGAETLALRLDRQGANAAALALHLTDHRRVHAVYYPGLDSHPQHRLAQRLFRQPGAILSFEPDPAIDVCDLLNRFDVVIKSSHLGDNRTLAIPVAHTIYYEMGRERRASMGIAESLIRVSVGIEEIDDLIQDFDRALAG